MAGGYGNGAQGGVRDGPGCYARVDPKPEHTVIKVVNNPFEQAERAYQDEADHARGTSSETGASVNEPLVNEPRNKALTTDITLAGQNVPGCQPKAGMPRPVRASLKRAPLPDEGTTADKVGHKRPCPSEAK